MPNTLQDRTIEVLKRNGQGLITDIQQELKDQGHYNTGKLAESLEASVSQTSDGADLDIQMNDYHVFVEKGVKAGRIPFGGRKSKGSKTSKYIQALINFFRSKGKSEKESKSAAFATAHAHKAEGMPTSGSKAYSSNGRRLKFIDEATQVSKQIETIENELLEEVENEAALMLSEFERSFPK